MNDQQTLTDARIVNSVSKNNRIYKLEIQKGQIPKNSKHLKYDSNSKETFVPNRTEENIYEKKKK